VLDVPAQPVSAPAHRDTFLGTGPEPRAGWPAVLGPSRRSTLLGTGQRPPLAGNPHGLPRKRTLLGTGSAAPVYDPLDEDSIDQISGVRAVEQAASDARASEDSRTTRPDSVSALRRLAVTSERESVSPWSQPPEPDEEPIGLARSERPTLTRLSIPKLRTAAHMEALFALTVALIVLATMAVLFL
jgi:hypothetical protein